MLTISFSIIDPVLKKKGEMKVDAFLINLMRWIKCN